MTAETLERRLLAFVNEAFLRGLAAIDANALLFEHGYVDSLRVLELIAFVEHETGRKVPDRMVRLSTFRSVRTIAATFAEGAHTATSDGERLHEYRTRNTQFVAPLDELVARHELLILDDGRIALHGAAIALLEFFDATVVAWAADLGADSREVPSRIALAALERADFTTAFPQLLVQLGDQHALTPAACYHVYPDYAGRTLAGEVVACVRARCHRNETETVPLERQREFSMREIVVLGTRQAVEDVRQRMLRRVGRFVQRLRLDGFVEAASDPFFTANTDGRRLAQRAGALKLELRLTLEGGRSVAVVSFNHHHEHFGSRFGIKTGGATAHSGCIAFGLERWVLAFLTQHGVDETRWPPEVRAWLKGEGRLGVRST